METVVFLEKGMGFGELALQSDQPRSATIQTTERTELLITKKADYETYAGGQPHWTKWHDLHPELKDGPMLCLRLTERQLHPSRRRSRIRQSMARLAQHG